MILIAGGTSLYSFFTTGSAENTRAFSALKFVLGVPVSMILIALAVGIWHQKQNFRIMDPGGFSLAAAFGVFTTGALFGLFVDGADTRTPAHYHGVIGGINLVFVGLFYTWLLPLLGRAVVHGKLVPGKSDFMPAVSGFSSLGCLPLVAWARLESHGRGYRR